MHPEDALRSWLGRRSSSANVPLDARRRRGGFVALAASGHEGWGFRD